MLFQIVEQNSVVLSISNEEVTHGLNANHKDMCKFRNFRDMNWHLVRDSILELVTLSTPGHTQTGRTKIGSLPSE